MAPPAVTEAGTPQLSKTREPRYSRRAKRVSIIVAAVVLSLAGLFWTGLWPYGRGPVVKDLAEASDSAVRYRTFHKIYFPFPGCVLDGLTFQHGDENGPPLIKIEKLTIRGSYFGILTRHVPRITAEGIRISIPPFGTEKPFHTQHSKTVVDEVIASGAVVEFESRDSAKPPLRFDIREASLRNVGWSGPLRYRMKIHNPEPPGEIAVSGEFGLWRRDDPGETPISGEYTFDHADLGVYHGIAGTLDSRGKFGGVIKHIDIAGSIDIPDFQVKSSSHRVQLITEFSAYVDARHGDTFLKRVDAHFWRTRVIAEGSIAGIPGHKGKTALINLTSQDGRIEDVLGLFVKERRAPMSGKIALRAKVEIPPGKEPFLKKVKLRGRFGIDEGSFTKPERQKDVDKLSAGARGEGKEEKDDPETVLSELKGQVALENGTATFSELSFDIPGATARMRGTFSVINHNVDLHGTMRVESKISNTTTGVKALLLKVMDPFFKKKKKGEIVPVHIGGTYEHPQFGLDISKQDAHRGDRGAPAKEQH
jgi:hypothetical protein